MKARSIAILVTLLGLSAPAHADDLSEARQHYARAQTHYAIGEFADAAREYQAAYKRKPDPALLFNAAQASRLAGLNRQALVLYRNYVNFYPRERNGADARAHIARLEPLVSSEEQVKSAPPMGTSEPRMGAAPAAVEPAKSAPSERRPVYKAWWLWTVVGVVVVGGVTAAVVATQVEGTPWATGTPVGPGASAAALRQAVITW